MAISNNVNSAIIAGQFGLQQSFDGMTQSALNIAQRTAQQDVAQNGPGDLLASASLRGLSTVSDLLPSGGDSLTSDLLSMQLYSMNALASAKVIDVANDTVGKIIDTIA
ncbi:hypothetical protein [Alteromonas lipolytica]|uniref:Flagellar biosynthesis protein FlgE n=1 Tax=Alteromonas lipolytica TaxID=1856405 RepID=A0A1E8FAW1_9ALTE|nr:hypothetical protein [Alteromonas lipolytica]OFI33050.1 hypothetical protein BFC17_01905 [Alteromonas lipolytica]GGF62984.1 hypothetical protein GCM10011338_14260 [Alteromonas lipolytica]